MALICLRVVGAYLPQPLVRMGAHSPLFTPRVYYPCRLSPQRTRLPRRTVWPQSFRE
jgi:hypothetical protein